MKVLGSLLACFIVFLILSAFLSESAHGFTLCRRSRQDKINKIDPDSCEHGTAKNYCGRTVCAKGPGERCGGPSQIHGRCGEGMHCKCETCTGCSIVTLECHFGRTTCF